MCLPFSHYRLKIERRPTVNKQTKASTYTRFQSIGGFDIDDFVHEQENKNTLKKNLCII